MFLNFKNILFDLDGTITDSAAGITKSVSYALESMGINSYPHDLRHFIGPPLKQSFTEHYLLSEKEALKAVHYYREYYRNRGIYENRLYPEINMMLAKLHASGRQLFIATSKPTYFADKILRHFQIDHYFQLVAGSNLDGSRVDKAEVVAYLLDKIYPLQKERTVMVGDRKDDIIAARACGITSIAVTYGYGSEEELQAAAPTHCADSVPGLLELLLS